MAPSLFLLDSVPVIRLAAPGTIILVIASFVPPGGAQSFTPPQDSMPTECKPGLTWRIVVISHVHAFQNKHALLLRAATHSDDDGIP